MSLPFCNTTVCVCCGLPFDAYERKQHFLYPANCTSCVYEAQFDHEAPATITHPSGRWTTKETPMSGSQHYNEQPFIPHVDESDRFTERAEFVHIKLTPAQARSLLGHAEKQVVVLKERIKFGEKNPGSEPMAHLLEEYAHWSGFAGDLKDEMMPDNER